ncbi:hypothetical protein ACFXTH_042062 [Malus domestica]
MLPDIWFRDKSSDSNISNWPNLLGSTPVKLFLERFREINFIKLVTLSGMSPFKLLLEMSMLLKRLRFSPNSISIPFQISCTNPTIMLSSTSGDIEDKAVMLGRQYGKAPDILFLEKSKT